MTPPARLSAAIAVLDAILGGQTAESALTHWARESRFAGSGDRSAVRDLVFQALRRKRSAAAAGGTMTGRGMILGLMRLQGADMDALFNGAGHAPAKPGPADTPRPATLAESLDCPDWLMPQLQNDLGDQFSSVMTAMQSRAKVFLRVNLRKGGPDTALDFLEQDSVIAREVEGTPGALEVLENAKKINTSRAYIDGLVELQDLSSQQIVLDLPLQDGDRVLDYCAGGGGKTLAVGSRCKARFYAHDAFAHRLKDLPARAARAGLAVQILADPLDAAPYDLVLCDVPCSGSGSWRRDPQGKWALTPEKLSEICTLQANILDRAAKLVQPQGVLCFATCSILRAENEQQVDAFLQRNPGWTCFFSTRMPLTHDGDGFFGAHFRRLDQTST